MGGFPKAFSVGGETFHVSRVSESCSRSMEANHHNKEQGPCPSNVIKMKIRAPVRRKPFQPRVSLAWIRRQSQHKTMSKIRYAAEAVKMPDANYDKIIEDAQYVADRYVVGFIDKAEILGSGTLVTV